MTDYVTNIRTLFLIAASLLIVSESSAQTFPRTTVYPNILYRGENVLTFSRPGGIERIEIATTRYVIAERSTGFLTECPDSVSIDVTARSVTLSDQLTATVYGCDGKTETIFVSVTPWTIKHEFSGEVPLDRDTCLALRIESGRTMYLDSITATHPNFRVTIPSAPTADGYVVVGNVPFRYNLCYAPDELGYGTDTILIHFRRDQPNGGYTTYTIAKPVTWSAVEPFRETPPEKVIPEEPRPIDPTAFRNVLLPTGRSQKEGTWSYGNYGLVGHLFGYGATDRFTLMAGGSYIPDFIARLALGTIGGKYEVVRKGDLSIAGGLQVALSSVTDSDIRTIAPYGVASYGTDRSRVTIALGYGFKQHTIPTEVFDRNAIVFGLGGSTEIGRGWKLNAELAAIESSGILPLLITGRRFGESWAIDFGLGFNLAGDADVAFDSFLSGKAESLPVIPYLSGMWIF